MFDSGTLKDPYCRHKSLSPGMMRSLVAARVDSMQKTSFVDYRFPRWFRYVLRPCVIGTTNSPPFELWPMDNGSIVKTSVIGMVGC